MSLGRHLKIVGVLNNISPKFTIFSTLFTILHSKTHVFAPILHLIIYIIDGTREMLFNTPTIFKRRPKDIVYLL